MLTVIIVILVIAFIGAYLEQRAEAREALRKQVEDLEQERKKGREDLVRFGATDVVAFGRGDGLDTKGREISDDELIKLETTKWQILNGGRQLAKALIKGGVVTVTYDLAGTPTLEEKGDNLYSPYERDFGPFVLSDFTVVRLNVDSAVLTYKAKVGHMTLAATAVWSWQGGRLKTVSYQVARA